MGIEDAIGEGGEARMVGHSRRYRAQLVILVLAAATVVLAAGGGSNGSANDGARDHRKSPATAATANFGGTDCPEDDNLARSAPSVVLNNPPPGGSDIQEMGFDRYIQLADSDKAVSKFIDKLANEEQSPIFESFASVYFDTTFAFTFPEVAVNEVEYLDEQSAVIVFTVLVDDASQTPQVLASAEAVARLVCSEGVWQFALADVCAILADGTGPPCPKKVKKKGKAALTRTLKKAELPEVSPPVVETVPSTTTTLTPAPAPPPFDGFCPYVGQPCSANVTNDPDCTCEPVPGTPGASKGFGVISCRAPTAAIFA